MTYPVRPGFGPYPDSVAEHQVDQDMAEMQIPAIRLTIGRQNVRSSPPASHVLTPRINNLFYRLIYYLTLMYLPIRAPSGFV